MTALVKHGENDWRLYHDDGTQIGSGVENRPNQAGMADILAEEYPGNSMLANATPRAIYTDIVTENVVFVDAAAGQVAPWNRTDTL